MEPTRNPSRDIRPGRAMQPGAPRERPLQRPVFNDFARPAHRDPSMRPVARPVSSQPLAPQPPAQAATQPHHAKPVHHTPVQPVASAAPQPVAAVPSTPTTAHHAHTPEASSALRPPAAFSDFTAAATPSASHDSASISQAADATPPPATTSALQSPDEPTKEHHAKHTKTKEAGSTNKTSHSGLVGLICFVLLMAMFFLPVLPGKVLDNFPGSSASFSTGDQALSCIDTLGPVKSTVRYDSKMGFPITYNYSTTTTQTATCKGVSLSAIGGHTSQFNPLGGFINAVIAFVIAFGVAKLWRWFAERKS